MIGIAVLTALHNPFGGYALDDGLYSRIQFLRMFREVFPEYADMADADLLGRLFARHPGFKTWIREETDGSPPLPIAIVGQPANPRLQPPPAYYGARPNRYSPYAVFPWLDEPLEYAGWVGSIVLAGIVWLWLLRDRRRGTA